jgi:hypothetical protein
LTTAERPSDDVEPKLPVVRRFHVRQAGQLDQLVEAVVALLDAGARTIDLSYHDRTATTAYLRSDLAAP